MSFKALDSLRIRCCLEPWLEKKSSKYLALADPVVKSIIISSIKQGTDKDSLKKNLEPFFSITKSNVGKFCHSLRKKVKEFSKLDNSQVEKSKEKNTVFPNKIPIRPPPVSLQKPELKKPKFVGKDTIIVHTKVQMPSTQLPPQKPVVEAKTIIKKANVPSFFLSSEEISLKTKDQKISRLLVNENGEQINERGEVIKTEKVKTNEKPAPLPFDRRIPTVKKPTTRQFAFIEPGTIAREAQEIRKQEEIDMSVASGLPIFDVIAMRRNYEIPSIDWWDEPFINKETGEPLLDEVDSTYQNTAPVPVPKLKEREIPTMLTPDERKREKHIKKLEKAKEERMLIKLNLKEPEPPRVKAKTLINFNSGEAFLKPTEVEMKAKSAAEARVKAHIERNEAAKLTPEQKREKSFQKRMEDSKGNVIELVYAMKTIYHPLQFAKCIAMAKKWMITGGIFIVKSPSMYFIVAECGEKAARKFSAEMESRIDWKMESEEVDKSITSTNECKIIFESPPLPNSRHFRDFRKYVFDVSTQCSRFFNKYKADHLFDPATRVQWE